jgi:hypothetical protein
VSGSFPFTGFEELRTDGLAAVRFENVERDDVSELGGTLRKDETRNDSSRFSDDAVRVLRLQIGFHLTPAVCDGFRKTNLIHRQQGIEV